MAGLSPNEHRGHPTRGRLGERGMPEPVPGPELLVDAGTVECLACVGRELRRIEWRTERRMAEHESSGGGRPRGVQVAARSQECERLEDSRSNQATWRLQSPRVISRSVVAMQNVEGSSPFIRFSRTSFVKPINGGASWDRVSP